MSVCCAALAVLALGAGPALAASVVAGSVSVSEVSSDGAVLHASVKPEGALTEYWFEYGTGEYTEAKPPAGSIALPARSAGAGTEVVSVGAPIRELTAGTAYHFRVVTDSGGVEVAGAQGSFSTQLAGGEFAGPVGREWELVSPPNKHGAGIEPPSSEGGLIQAAADGDGIVYIASGPTEGSPAGNRSPEYTPVLSTRGPTGGWTSKDIATPHNEVGYLAAGYRSEYLLFSSDLSVGLVEPQGSTPLPPLPEGSERTIYLRDDATGGFIPLVTSENVIPGARVSDEEEGKGFSPEFVGASTDLSHILFVTPEKLTDAAFVNHAIQNLYEWVEGSIRLVSVLPDGEPAAADGITADLGEDDDNVRDAVSVNGKRIVWEGESHLYLRDMGEEKTVLLDEVQPGAKKVPHSPGESPKIVYEGADSDGSRVFFTDGVELTADSNATATAPDLYVYEAPGPVASGELLDLTPTTGSEGAGVLGVVPGTSQDGSYVYFVANVALPSAIVKGVPGEGDCTVGQWKPNRYCYLYVLHFNEGKWSAPVYIATLSDEDGPDWKQAITGELQKLSAGVSANGRYLAFMSNRNITGYDNDDAASGAPDEEVYLYDAVSETVRCISCNPTGARPRGVFDAAGAYPGLLGDRVTAWSERWLAGSLPTWTASRSSQAMYQPRYLDDDGRVFFDAADGLVPAAVNGLTDVYEYEPEGVGGCEPDVDLGSGAVYSAAAGGCVGLVSGGTSSEESTFLDASESGGDVFFLTTSKLVPEDVDSAFDVYDAHLCTEASPCASGVVDVPPACSDADSCRAAPTPQPQIFGAPATATFNGAGNTAATVVKPVVKAKALTRLEKLKDALRSCGRRRGRSRSVCEAGARKRYRAGTSRVQGRSAGRGK